MEPIESNLTGNDFALIELEDKLKPLGFMVGDNWDYKNGSFDYKLDDEDGYQFLRVPFHIVDGALDQDGAIVQVDIPFLLHHKYKLGPDDDVDMSTTNATINQFQTPTEKDADVSDAYIKKGKDLVDELERTLLS